MKILISEDGTFPAVNLIHIVQFKAGVYPVIEKVTVGLSSPVTYYLVENNEGEAAKVLDKYCTEVPEETPILMSVLNMHSISEKLAELEPEIVVELRDSTVYRQANMLDENVYLKKGTVFDVLHVTREPDYTQYTVRTSKGENVHLYGDEVIVRPKPVLKPGDNTENRRYMYVIVRTDMELQNIIVQSAHAAYESGLAFKNHADRTTIIVLQTKSEMSLKAAYDELQKAGVQCTMYKEHTLGLGYTAIGTEAFTEDQRKHMRKYKLLKVQ